MNVKKRLALILVMGLSINAVLPNYMVFAGEKRIEVQDSIILTDTEKTTDSHIKVEESVTTSSVLLISQNNKYDKNEEVSQKIEVQLILNENKLQKITNDEAVLVYNEDYSVNGSKVAIEDHYLADLETGQYTFSFFLTGEDNKTCCILTLEIECMDTSNVYQLINEAEYLIAQSVTGTVPGSFYLRDQLIFRMAIAQAKENAEKAENQLEVERIYSELMEAVRVFKNSVICSEEELDKNSINELISEAEALYESIQTGSRPGMCSESSKIAFEIAVLDAKDNVSKASTQHHLEQAAVNLQAAIIAFKNSRVPYLDEDINQDGKVDVQDLALVMYYYRAEEEDEIWEKAQYTDIHKDGVIDLLDLVQVANKIIEE